LVELLVSVLVSLAVLAGFTAFYVAQQRSFRRHQIEIAASQSLRNALEQMSRDLRSAGLDPTGGSGAGLTLADTAEVDFTLDADADGAVSSTDPAESKRFRLNGTTIESYQAGSTGSWVPLADSVSGLTLSYYACGQTSPMASLPLSSADRAAVVRIDISVTVGGSGGITLTRQETESVRLRNRVCS
jgi:type IV pilus assembly protein PilW